MALGCRGAMRVEDEDLLGRWKAIEFVIIVLMIGFAFGYLCAIQVERARTEGLPVEEKTIGKITSTIGTQSAEPKRRTVGAQSQCTYKRKLVSPRFHVLPQVAGGVFV